MISSKFNQKNYDIWSSTYDNSPNPTVMIDEFKFPDFYKNWSGKKILELGCGTGRHTKRLVGQGNIVMGIDLSEGMLSQAKKKLPNIDFIHADFLNYQFENNSFDKILVSLVLEHITDLDLFFQKVHSILKPYGEILISELHPERAANGSFARFTNDDGDEIRLLSISHTEEFILKSAENTGLKLNFKRDIFGDPELVKMNEKWGKYLDRRMVQFWSFFN